MNASSATYGVLGMLATRPWTGYELTQQVRRSLRFVWPVSEGHLYREQGRLVELGWATVTEEAAGKRSRKRYAITDAGRVALADWLATPPEEPHLQVEGVLRAFYADHGTVADLEQSLRATADGARAMLDDLRAIVGEYLDDDGPLTLLESGQGGPGDRREFHGRPMYPERLPVVALAIDATTRLLAELDGFFAEAADEVASWASTHDATLAATTRARLETVRDR
ncbi:MAG: PadR family transcriptional regulator [Mycobacteriales bacterium]|nr:PadR family transcriptional regulator [Mycobacteriales bacterium]